MFARLQPGLLTSLVAPSDFQRLLSTRPVARSSHFSLHHAVPEAPELSTGSRQLADQVVESHKSIAPPNWRLGLVVPKRQARRAVTRNLVKRQVREMMRQHLDQLPPGDWVVRLRAPVDAREFASGASTALKLTLRGELIRLFGAAVATPL
jgi:ribonuclease P protein component